MEKKEKEREGRVTYDMIGHRDEQVEEPVSEVTQILVFLKKTPFNASIENRKKKNSQQTTGLHLHLHGPAPLERGPAADDQSEVMGPQLRVALGRIRIRIPRTRQDGAALNARLQTLLAQRQPLELVQAVPFRGAVDQRVLEQHLAARRVVDGRLRVLLRRHFELPRVSPLVVQEAGVVVAFVEVFEDGGEDFRELFGQVDPFGGGLEELAAADGGEEGGVGEDVFVGGEEALLGADAEGDDGGGQVARVEQDFNRVLMM